MRFKDRVAVITGGGRGIGAATARRFAEEGAAVVVADLDLGPAKELVAEIEKSGGRALAVACNVTERASVEALFKAAVDKFGQVDILVACAGIIRDNLVHKMTDDDWDGVIDTHLKGTFLCAQAAQALMTPRKYGKMVFLSSTSALGNRGQANYSTAKAGLRGWPGRSRSSGALQHQRQRGRPGFVDTRMTMQTAERMGVDYESFKTAVASQTPLQRVGTPEDLAAVIAFLCSDDAAYVSGQTLYVRGGP